MVQDIQMLEQMLKVEPEINQMVKKIILMEDSNSQRKSPACSENVLSWAEVLEIGNEVPDTVLTDIENSQAVNQACMLIQTSGTTGPPKGNPNYFTKSKDMPVLISPKNLFLGVMLSHDNLTWTTRICMEQYNWHKERTLSYLPMSHVAGIFIGQSMSFYPYFISILF